MWIIMAALSAFFAGITAILAKCGIQKTDSDLATALRTIVVLLFAWGMVFLAGSQNTLLQIKPYSLLFLILSGLATGASWLCYFKSLSVGEVTKVAAIDKSSTVFSIVIAMICFSETDHIAIKVVGIALLSVGIFVIAKPKSKVTSNDSNNTYIAWAVASSIFAALTSVLAKVGIHGVESNLGTAIRTGVVLIMAWAMVFLQGKQKQLSQLSKKELKFIILSGVTTGVSWLCYYNAIQNGVVSVVVPIDKMSILITVLFSHLFLREKVEKKTAFGLIFMLTGTLIMTITESI